MKNIHACLFVSLLINISVDNKIYKSFASIWTHEGLVQYMVKIYGNVMSKMHNACNECPPRIYKNTLGPLLVQSSICFTVLSVWGQNMSYNGAFTLPENNTETDIDNKYTDPNENPCWCLSLCNVNICTQSYGSHFLSVSVSVIVNTPLERSSPFYGHVVLVQ